METGIAVNVKWRVFATSRSTQLTKNNEGDGVARVEWFTVKFHDVSLG